MLKPLVIAATLAMGSGFWLPNDVDAEETRPSDDTHNHDGSHPDSPVNCGTNYMLPGETARLGSHSFMIIGQEDATHILAEHRSGTPPHNYQFLLRVRLDPDAMKAYREILADSKTLPAFTTIYFDASGKQVDRTFFCLSDLPKIFGDGQRKGDAFDKLFPIRASLQKNPDHEGSFDIEKSVVPGKFISLNRKDVELVVYRYLPAYLPQDLLRKAIREREKEVLPLLNDAPAYATEPRETAAKRPAYTTTDGAISKPGTGCPRSNYLKGVTPPATIHTFMLMAELDANTVLAAHYYDEAPQNFQTIVKLKLTDDGMKLYRQAKKGTAVPPLFQTERASAFCMENIRDLVKGPPFALTGTIYRDAVLNEYRRGTAVGRVTVPSSGIEVLVNRRLESFLNPVLVAKDALRPAKPRGDTKAASAAKSADY